MGGVKKKSLASMERKQDSKDTEQQAGDAQKEKKGTEQKTAPQQHKRLPFLVPKMTEDDMIKSLAPLKAITIYTASRALGVNASIATGVLRDLEDKENFKGRGLQRAHGLVSRAEGIASSLTRTNSPIRRASILMSPVFARSSDSSS